MAYMIAIALLWFDCIYQTVIQPVCCCLWQLRREYWHRNWTLFPDIINCSMQHINSLKVFKTGNKKIVFCMLFNSLTLFFTNTLAESNFDPHALWRDNSGCGGLSLGGGCPNTNFYYFALWWWMSVWQSCREKHMNLLPQLWGCR